MSTTVAVAGASGYAGGELLRLLAAHPDLEVTTVTANSNAGRPLVETQPHLRSLAHLTLQETSAETLAGHDAVFLALPHGASAEIAAALPDDALVIDCGADHRLIDPADWDAWYGDHGHPHAPAWTYGIPELVRADGTSQREALAATRRIAAPGCNASAVTIALAPAIRAGLVDADDLVAVLAVGTSGAGKAATTHLLFSEQAGSATPYQVGGVHRHVPEILQNLRLAGAVAPSLSFTPVLVPLSRGILATSTATLRPGASTASVRAAYEEAYGDEPFVHLLPEGQWPRSGDTTGANTVLLGLAVDERAGRLVVVSALDNLTKGTAGAAIQSANLALGLPETTGLPIDGVAP